MAAAVPDQGRILDLGCGHGLMSALLALTGSGREVVGVDVDGDKIEAAARAAGRLPEGSGSLAFRPLPPGDLPEGRWDAIVIVDVLYLIAVDVQRQLLHRLAGLLEPGGVLVVKEMALTPAWKFRWMKLQEQLAVQLLGITAGHDLTFTDPERFAAWMADSGLTIEQRRLDRRFVHPHHLVVGTRPR